MFAQLFSFSSSHQQQALILASLQKFRQQTKYMRAATRAFDFIYVAMPSHDRVVVVNDERYFLGVKVGEMMNWHYF
jgi:hypothetical protein